MRMKLFLLGTNLLYLICKTRVLAFLPSYLPSKSAVTTKPAKFPDQTRLRTNMNDSMSLQMFGGIFGGNGGKLVLDDAGELVVHTSNPSDSNYDMEFEGLSDYIQKWAQLFTTGSIKLTTPVQVIPIASDERRGVRLVFQNIDTGYKSKKEEDENTKEGTTERKKPVTKQGGLEIGVEKAGDEIRVRALRCEIDEDTIIKEMSEETILNELKQAIDIWEKDK